MFSLAFYKSADGMTWKKSSREKRLSEKFEKSIIQSTRTKIFSLSAFFNA